MGHRNGIQPGPHIRCTEKWVSKEERKTKRGAAGHEKVGQPPVVVSRSGRREEAEGWGKNFEEK
jgi:hypothetical protein